MDFVKWGLNPWGQDVLTHVSWTLFWASLFAGLMFLVAHASYMLLSAHRKRPAAETDRLEAAHANLPKRIERHSLMARAFHWVMAAAMFVLLFTAFLPVVGVQFPWVTWHWIAGLVLTGSIIFHIIHASFWLDFWSIWVGPKDIPEFKAEILRELGPRRAGPQVGQVSARQPPVSHGDRGGRAVGCRDRRVDDVARADAVLHAQPVSLQRRDLGRDLRAARRGRRRPGRPASSRTSTSPSGRRSGGSPSR